MPLLQGIRLAVFARTSTIKACGIAMTMKPILDDIMALQKEGLSFKNWDDKYFEHNRDCIKLIFQLQSSRKPLTVRFQVIYINGEVYV
uniref:Uncharacterized protein n=1 Tax=Romanomermis culicivorax TaxID=13658 RepID=A0A915HKW5_ROMCU